MLSARTDFFSDSVLVEKTVLGNVNLCSVREYGSLTSHQIVQIIFLLISLNYDHFLDWSNLDSTVASVLLKWIYTSKVSQENLTLNLMKTAASFQLIELVDQCERYLIGTVGLKDCVVLYAAAEELGTVKLKEHCSSLISVHWVRLR